MYNIYVWVSVCLKTTNLKKESMNLKERKKEYVGKKEKGKLYNYIII